MNCLQVKQNIEEYKNQAYADYSLRKRNKLQGSKNKLKNFQIDLFNSLSNDIKELPFKEFKLRLGEILLIKLFTRLTSFEIFSIKGFKGFYLNFFYSNFLF